MFVPLTFDSDNLDLETSSNYASEMFTLQRKIIFILFSYILIGVQ